MEKTVHKKNVGNKRLRAMLISAVCALVIALILLFASGFSFVKLLRGPEEVAMVTDTELGAYVRTDINDIVGYFAEDYSPSKDAALSRWAVSRVGSRFVAVHLPERYLDSGDTIFNETLAFYSGELLSLEHYFQVEGSVEEMSEEPQAMLYDWFG